MSKSPEIPAGLLQEHPFLRNLLPRYQSRIGECAIPQRLEPGHFVFRRGGPAEGCYLIRHGKVSLEVPLEDQGRVVVETLNDGGVVGWSWLVPPYRASLDARVLEPTSVIYLDGACLRRLIDSDDELGFVLYKLFKPIMARYMAVSRRLFPRRNRADSG